MALCMIVKDEEAVIDRCIQSALPIIDRIIVVDTGSRDRTMEILWEYRNLRPVVLHQRKWINFGVNRSELMSVARYQADWLLLMDADHELVVNDELPELDPAVDAYMVKHLEGWEYEIPRLVRGGGMFTFRGATHEYLVGADRRASLPQLAIKHHADGGSRADKFYRDLSLLHQDLLRDPTDTRAMFYLARTYDDLGEVAAACVWYDKRAASGGWEEEAWWAAYRAAVLRESLPELLMAQERRPWRAEPLAAAARLCLRKGWPHNAALLAEACVAIPKPEEDILFVDTTAYKPASLFLLKQCRDARQ